MATRGVAERTRVTGHALSRARSRAHGRAGFSVFRARFAEHAFDLVIDKACLDALVCNEGDPWDPDAEVVENMTAALRSVVHVLRPGGVFVSIGFQQPHFRKRYLRREGQTFGWEENIVVKKRHIHKNTWLFVNRIKK